MKDPKTFNAKNFKALRLKYKYSQKKLGNELHFKRQTISSWEHGKTNPSTETLFAVSDVYGMPSDEVFAICYCEREIIFPAEELLEETALTVTEESHGSIEEYTALITVPRAIAAVSCNALTTKAVTVPATREPNSYPPPEKTHASRVENGLDHVCRVVFHCAIDCDCGGCNLLFFWTQCA